MPHYLRVLGSGLLVLHCRAVSGHRAVEILRFTTALPRARGQWPMELLQWTAALHFGSRRWNSCAAVH